MDNIEVLGVVDCSYGGKGWDSSIPQLVQLCTQLRGLAVSTRCAHCSMLQLSARFTAQAYIYIYIYYKQRRVTTEVLLALRPATCEIVCTVQSTASLC
jgi:hypothetical protein